MSVKYVDISVDHGIGNQSGSDASNYAGFLDIFNLDSSYEFKSFTDEYRLRGSRILEASGVNIAGEATHYHASKFVAWDSQNYGPWRFSGGTGGIAIYNMNEVSGGVLDTTSNDGGIGSISISRFTGTSIDGTIGNTCTINNMFINGEIAYISILGNSAIQYGFSINGSTIIGRGESGSGYGNVFLIDRNNQTLDMTATDTIFSSPIYGLRTSGTGIVNFIANNCVIDKFKDDTSFGTLNDTQTSWTAPTWPSWDDSSSAFNSSVLSDGINTPPEPGNTPYTGYETGLWGEPRTGIGAFYFTTTFLNNFPIPPIRNGNEYLSQIDNTVLISLIGSDPYFSSTAKISRIDITYMDPGLREKKEIAHYWNGTLFEGSVSWSTTAASGTWLEMGIRVRDQDGAVINLTRAQLGSSVQDISL